MSSAVGKSNQRREQILIKAMEMFGQVGYRGASLRDIATRVGMTHPGLLYHFQSKAELLEAVLARWDQRDLAYYKILESSDPMKQIEGLLANIAANINTRGMVELFVTLAGEATDPSHPAHDYFWQRYCGWLARTEQVIWALKAEEKLSKEVNPAILAREFVALMEGLQMQWLYFPDEVDVVRILCDHVNEFLIEPIDCSLDFYALAREYAQQAEAGEP